MQLKTKCTSYAFIHTYISLDLEHLLYSDKPHHGVTDICPLSLGLFGCSRGLGI